MEATIIWKEKGNTFHGNHGAVDGPGNWIAFLCRMSRWCPGNAGQPQIPEREPTKRFNRRKVRKRLRNTHRAVRGWIPWAMLVMHVQVQACGSSVGGRQARQWAWWWRIFGSHMHKCQKKRGLRLLGAMMQPSGTYYDEYTWCCRQQANACDLVPCASDDDTLNIQIRNRTVQPEIIIQVQIVETDCFRRRLWLWHDQ